MNTITLRGIKAEIGMVGGKIGLRFPFNVELKDAIKKMDGARWEPETKTWTVNFNNRNTFQLSLLQGVNVYQKYDDYLKAPPDITTRRPLYKHQEDMKGLILAVRTCVIAGEMGTGKTLAAIEAMEDSGLTDWWYVAPRSALLGVQIDFRKWKASSTPQFMTYEGMVKRVKEGAPTPGGVFFDESSRLKNPMSQRSQCAMALAEAMRDEHKTPYIVCMTGTPAPKDPTDWYWQVEIVEPGFIREGNQTKFRARLALMTYEDRPFGGDAYPVHQTWWDNPDKCAKCGVLQANHKDLPHPWAKSVNEIAALKKRLDGVVLVRLKKDCLDLPEKRYRIYHIEPDKQTLDVARSLVDTSPRSITALTLLRELSDGFQYDFDDLSEQHCPHCTEETRESCAWCGGRGKIFKYARKARRMASRKLELVRHLLEEYEDVGRLVFYGGFWETVDLIAEAVAAAGWDVIKADGRGWINREALPHMIHGGGGPDKLAFVGHPEAAGMGLTFTASPAVCYLSNPFNAEARIQSEDRIHRIGMDANRGATVIDICHLPVDYYVLANLKRKRSLQGMTLGDLRHAAEDDIFRDTEIIKWTPHDPET